MNWLNIFGTKKNKKDWQTGLQSLRTTFEDLEKREIYLSKKIQGCKEKAKYHCSKKEKRKAISLLKKSKIYETQLSHIYGQKQNIELQILNIEQTISNKNTINSLKAGKQILSEISSEVKLNQVEDLMDELNDCITKSDEISSVIAEPIGEIYDDEELLNEFESEQKELEDHALLLKKNEITEYGEEYEEDEEDEEEEEENDVDKELLELEKMMIS